MKKTVENQSPEGSEPLKKLLWGGGRGGGRSQDNIGLLFVVVVFGGRGGVFSGQLWSGNIVFWGGGGGVFSGQHLT